MMTIRMASFVDIPQIVALAADALARSRYAAFARLDAQAVKAVAFDCIAQHAPVPGRAALFMADGADRLDACFLGTVTPLYFGTDALVGSNLFFYAREDAPPTAALRLLRAFERWAQGSDRLTMFRYGFSDAISDPEKTARAFEASGCRRAGFIYEKETT
ncbi:MAG: hypothetical protein KDK24_09965 [Pseudooceanicola sp.]|nr:hypothetical protein [Pseudooceanicola sp.]